MYIEASFIDISTLDIECIMDLIIISRFNKIIILARGSPDVDVFPVI